MRRNRITAFALCFLAWTTAAVSAVQAADTIPSDRLLPPEVSIFATVPDVGELKSRWQDSMYGKLHDDADLAGLRSELGKLAEVLSKHLREDLGVSLEELLELPSGDMTFAVIREPNAAPAMLGLLNYGENEETLDKLIERAAEAYQIAGAEQSSEEFEDTRITVFTRSAQVEAGKPAQPDRTTAYFRKDSYIVVSTHVSALKSVLVRWDGQHSKTFADNAVHQYIDKRCASNHDRPLFSWYFNPIDFVKTIAASSPEQGMSLQIALGFLPTLGLDQLKGVGGAFDMSTEEFETVNQMVAYVEEPTSGILNALKFPATDQTPPDWVTAQCQAYWSVNWDVESAYLAIEKLVDSFYGAGATSKQIQQLADRDGGPMLHLKNDVLDQLTGRIQIVEAAPQSDEDESSRVIAALEVKDVGKAASVVSSVASRDSFPGKVREFRGIPLYELPSSNNGDDAVAFTVANGHLFVASDVSLVEEILRADNDRTALAGTKEYRQIAAHFPAKTSIVNFQREDAQIRAGYELLRTQGDGESIGVADFDFSKLPPFDVVKKYMRPTGSYVVPDAQGVLFVTFSPRESK